jgi:hypothetical protein
MLYMLSFKFIYFIHKDKVIHTVIHEVTSHKQHLRNKVKVKCTLVQELRLCTGLMAHRESRCIALLFHDHGTRRG